MASTSGKSNGKSLTAKNAKARKERIEKSSRKSEKKQEDQISYKKSPLKRSLDGAPEAALKKKADEKRTVEGLELVATHVPRSHFTNITEDLALAFLGDANSGAEEIEQIFQNQLVMKSRKVRMAAVCHPKAPRRLTLNALRHLFTLDLMNVALTPTTPADIKRAAEEILMTKLESSAAGVRLTLARRGSGRIAGALIVDREQRIVDVALENPRVTEAMVAKAAGEASEDTVGKLCRHPKWSIRNDIRIALLRSEHTPLARALEFARGIPKGLLEEVLQKSRLPNNVKKCLLASSS
jgi:hypothetical protein